MDINHTRIHDVEKGEQLFAGVLDVVVSRYASMPAYIKWSCMIFVWLSFISLLHSKPPRIPGAKVHGSRGWWEPSFLLKVRFLFDARNIISSGYKKYKDVPFIVRRLDTDIHILPMKYLDELRRVPRGELSAKMVHYNNLFRSWPWASVIHDSDLHVTVLSKKLNPEVSRYLEMANEELDFAWKIDMPNPAEWTEVDIQQAMRMLIARMSAKVFVGEPTCRDPKWLDLTINFSMDLFVAGFALRMFPPWMHFLVKPFIPARWRVQRQIDIGTDVVRDFMSKREGSAQHDGKMGESTLFEWMVNNAVGNEGSLKEMAARQCILTLASIHTTATSIAGTLFDIIKYPEWVPVLADEIEDSLIKHGEPGQNMPLQEWLKLLEKMDSFILESQRFNPAVLLVPQRLTMVPMTLRDGTLIPKGVRVGWAGPQHSFDPEITPDPEKFDPMRSYRKRHMNNGENLHKFMVGQSDPDNMTFGYGSQLCPGRYFAVGEIKLMLMRLLREYEFKALEGKGSPKIIYADENLILDPYAKVMMRRKKVHHGN